MQHPYSVCETAFSQVDLFLDQLFPGISLRYLDQIFSFLLDSLKSLLDHCKGTRKTYKAWTQSKELAHLEMYQRYAAASLAHVESANKTHGIVGRPV